MYYPKSQIKENLYTNGGELQLADTLQEYKGYYYITSQQIEVYTGKNTQDKPNNRLKIYIFDNLKLKNLKLKFIDQYLLITIL
jgi:hypothetical protein